jgi:hypothetical protein
VSKRHNSSRRKAYGRRQHELHERADRRRAPERVELSWDEPGTGSAVDPFAFLDPRTPRLRFVLGD